MSNGARQLERFGRVTGNTLRRSPQSNRYADHFVLMKRTNHGGHSDYDRINGQLQELVSDGDLQASTTMVYSLNKQKRWELPGLLKESICRDGEAHQDLDFKVLLVEWHLDSHGVLGGACTGVYQSKAEQPVRLPRQRYAHAQDLRRGARLGGPRDNEEEEALRGQIARLRRSAKNRRGGREAHWRATLDSMQQRVREAEERRRREAEQEEEDTPQVCYEVGYCRPENKYPWRPEMKVNLATSKRAMGTKCRHQDKTSVYLDDVRDVDGSAWDDLYEDVRAHSEFDQAAGGEGSEDDACYLVGTEGRPKATFGEAFVGSLGCLARRSKQGSSKKRRRRKSDGSAATAGPAKRSAPGNRASSGAWQVHPKGTAVYDPQAAIYRPEGSLAGSHHHLTTAAQPVSVQGHPASRCCPTHCLQLDGATLRPAQLRDHFGTAYAEAQCRPRRFAIQIIGEGNPNPNPVGRSPGESVYALFESSGKPSTAADFGEWLGEEEDQPWQVVKESSEFRLSVYGQEGRLTVTSECLVEAFLPTGVFTVQEVMKYLQSALHSSSQCAARNSGHRGARGRTPFGQLSLDTPTVRAELGWNTHICTPDEAYREMAEVRGHQSSDEKPDCVPRPQTSPNTCGICYEELSRAEDREDVFTLPPNNDDDASRFGATTLTTCGHAFCDQCWGQYLRSEVRQGAADITCPEYGCKTPVDRVTSMAFLSPAEFQSHYERCRDASLARSGRHHRCPNALCGRVARVGGGRVPVAPGDAVMVKCRCRHLWCTQCLEDGHWPMTCQQADAYRLHLSTRLKMKDDPPITHVQVKRCPGCKVRWEKNGGCPSMVCGMCHLNFCWLCLRPYNVHDFNLCRRIMTSPEAVSLDYRIPSRDLFLEIAVEHHSRRVSKALRSKWLAVATLASRSAMVQVSSPGTDGGMRPPCLMTADVVMATAAATRHQPLTWARTQQHLAMMSQRMGEVHDIVAFCHEGNFVLEHLAYFLGCMTRRQRKAKWWRTMQQLMFTVQTTEETLSNLVDVKKSESGAVMDRLCGRMEVGKDCLRKLARMMQHCASQQLDTK